MNRTAVFYCLIFHSYMKLYVFFFLLKIGLGYGILIKVKK